eukprot:comp11623_c0_seq1/m.6127 comp11623_c0_seq1/g.6127  ORF comp11623_c0_seq1/g.6127 comp11623_c0_seq1/m.6127 type:complete len:267 (-) comp11623_c0_seq1:29-829(-)
MASGSFKAGVDRGMEYRSDGSQYVGQYKHGRPHGLGVLHWQDGERYQGQFCDGLREGFGMYTRADGAPYEGQWVKDAKEGIGREVYPGECMYVGGWSKNMWHGLGRTVDLSQNPARIIHSGQWAHNLVTDSHMAAPLDETFFQNVVSAASKASEVAAAAMVVADGIVRDLSDPQDNVVNKLQFTVQTATPIRVDVELTAKGTVRLRGRGMAVLQGILYRARYRQNLHQGVWELTLNGCDGELAERYGLMYMLDEIRKEIGPVTVTR